MPLPIAVGIVFGLLALWIAGSNPACGVGLLVMTVMVVAALSAGTAALRQATADDLRTKKGQIVIWRSSPYVLVDVSDNSATLRSATITAAESRRIVSAPPGEIETSSMSVGKIARPGTTDIQTPGTLNRQTPAKGESP